MGGHWKIWFLRGVAKHQYIGGNCIKGGARTVCRFKRGASGKRWCFWGGLITHLHTMLKVSFLSHISHKMRYMLQDLNIDQENTYIHTKLPLFVFTFTFVFYFLLMFDWNKYASNSIWFYCLLNNYLSFYFNESQTNNLLTSLSLHWQLAPWHLPIITWVFLQCKTSSPTTKATGTQGSCLSQETVQSQ